MRSALSDRVKANRLLVMDEFKVEKVKTKAVHEILKNKLQLDKVLIVDEANANLELSGRNIPRVRILRSEGLNVYDIVRYDWVLFTKRAVQAVESRLAPNS
ncbi:MAG: 50S ribosomal protein L4 [Bdellovibrionales bacterium RIFOXYC1_FULL_54_43]|nr:MAG: 50S ribosomal protein L4 [Bdellovibrionales bacterium RIFOXYC1_FULL_54_43]